MLIRKYLPGSRERGQQDENQNSLLDFCGPVELWSTYPCPSELYQVRLHVVTNNPALYT
jgi:hypothetical protein